MRILVDTNVILRFSDPSHAQHRVAATALELLETQGHELRLVPQVVYEYWVAGTRPLENNGLGFSPAELQQFLTDIVALLPLLRDERVVFDHWLKLAGTHDVRGKKAHDTRLAAAMLRHEVTHLLTFNGADFLRYPHVTVIDPADVAATA